jgi:hypothetical protein
MSKVHQEMTLKELHAWQAGELLLAIGKGDFRDALYRAMELAMRNGYEHGERASAEESPQSYVPQRLASECINVLERAGYGRPGQPNTLQAMVKSAVAEVVRLRKDVESWKRRAEQHGCDVENGDADCG